jgi:sortase A
VTRRLAHILGTLLVVAGVLTLAWVVCVWRWQDPFTAAYTHFQQARLAKAYDRRVAGYRPRLAAGNLAAVERQVAGEARAYRESLHRGDPIGRLKIGRIGLNMVVVQGTDHTTLKRGPGHYGSTALPGQGHLIYVAGHRTTYLAPFAYINNIRAGDFIQFEVPYGTFTYRVTRHYVVAENDVRVLADHGSEILRLQACHPRFFATHRYLVDARLVSVLPRGGSAYKPGATAAHLMSGLKAARS